MRISDWSSDVCSSDLVPDPDACGARHVPAPARLGVVAAGVHRTGDERGRGRRAVAAAQPQGHPPRARLKSEEHTSELQSLMRISYAVFCLKKKNKTLESQNKTQQNKNNNLDTYHQS